MNKLLLKIAAIWDMPPKRFVLIVSVFILILRIGYVSTLENSWYFFDTIHYDTAAQHIVKGEGFGPGLHYYNIYKQYSLEPVYPLFLAGIYSVFGHSFLAVRIAQSILGLLTLLFLYLIAKNLMPERYARGVLLFGGVYPFFIYIAGLLYATQIFTFFIVLGVWIFIEYFKNPRMWLMLVGGIVLGFAVLSIPVYVVALPLFVLWVFLFSKQTFSKRFTAALVLSASIVLILIPWTVRNYMVFHEIKYARAFIPQEEAFSQVFWKIEREKSFQKQELDVENFSFYYYEQDDKSYLDCFINNTHFFTLNPYKKLSIPDSGYYNGLIFFGKRKIYVKENSFNERTIVGQDTLETSIWDSKSEIELVTQSETVKTENQQIVYQGFERGWDKPVFVKKLNIANFFDVHYEQPLSPKYVNRVALLVFMDSMEADGDGYMVWLHPWLEPDLWHIKDQKPDSSVAVLKSFADGRSINLMYLLKNYPYEYVFKHYIPEFINFWSPGIARISSKDRVPGLKIQIVAIASFTPILLLMPFGIWAARKNWRLLILYLIPILTVSAGYSLFFTETRYRIPIDGFVVLFAFVGASWLVSRLKMRA